MIDLAGRVILVTGGSRGIGAGIAQVLLAAGAELVLHYNRSEAGARAIAAEAPSGRCHLVGADLLEPQAPLGLWRRALAFRGRIDVLVNNAAVRLTCGLEAGFEEVDAAWTNSMRVNAIAPAHLCRLATSEWKAQKRGGIIINVSSRPAFRGDRPHFYHDGASKAALTSLTYGLARFCAEDDVTAFVVVPGIIETEQMREYARHYDVSEALAEIPLKAFGTPEDVGKIVAFLASGEARYSTGSTIDVSGASYIH
jgi:NAD(P)-dependent dehydrogenase (short-subunit alcohol dehydrogenase family)